MTTLARGVSAAKKEVFDHSIGFWGHIADGLNWLTLKLYAPTHYSSENIIHSFMTPIRPGEFGNEDSAWLEVASRVFQVVVSVLLIPVAAPASILGIGLDFLGSCVQPKPYTYMRGSAKEKIDDGDFSKFFSLNACMFWGGLPILFGGVRPASDRIDEIADIIRKQDPDVLVMQEMSFAPARDLYAKLKSSYAHFYTRIGTNPARMESCLFVACKYPVCSEPVFVPFPEQNGIRRGVFCIETPTKWVLTTHLESGGSKESKRLRKEQLALINQTIIRLQERSNKPWVLLGDLNVDRADGSDEVATSGIGAEYYYPRSLESTCTNLLTAYAKGEKEPEKASEAVDYALVDERIFRNFHVEEEIVSTYDLKNKGLASSDHKGLALSIERAEPDPVGARAESKRA